MGNGVSGDQGNLPAHGKRDVREGIGAKRHDWSELARTREIVTSPPIPTSYSSSDDVVGKAYTPCPRKKQATFIFAITSPSVKIFLQFLKHFVQE